MTEKEFIYWLAGVMDAEASQQPFAPFQGKCETGGMHLEARVADLESQLESVACRAATAENRVAELEQQATSLKKSLKETLVGMGRAKAECHRLKNFIVAAPAATVAAEAERRADGGGAGGCCVRFGETSTVQTVEGPQVQEVYGAKSEKWLTKPVTPRW